VKVRLKVEMSADVVVEMTAEQFAALEENLPCCEDGLPGTIQIDWSEAMNGLTDLEIVDADEVKPPKSKAVEP
jgi:hypothetical protein